MELDQTINKLSDIRNHLDHYTTDETMFEYGVRKAQETWAQYQPTAEDLEEQVARSGIVLEKWGHNTKKVHPAAYAAPGIASMAEVHQDVVTEKGIEEIHYFGFKPDVVLALTLTDLVHAFMEARWEDTRNSPEYAASTRNKRIQMRPALLRNLSVWARQKMVTIASQTSLSHTLGLSESGVRLEKRRLMGQVKHNIAKRAA